MCDGSQAPPISSQLLAVCVVSEVPLPPRSLLLLMTLLNVDYCFSTRGDFPPEWMAFNGLETFLVATAGGWGWLLPPNGWRTKSAAKHSLTDRIVHTSMNYPIQSNSEVEETKSLLFLLFPLPLPSALPPSLPPLSFLSPSWHAPPSLPSILLIIPLDFLPSDTLRW